MCKPQIVATHNKYDVENSTMQLSRKSTVLFYRSCHYGNRLHALFNTALYWRAKSGNYA